MQFITLQYTTKMKKIILAATIAVWSTFCLAAWPNKEIDIIVPYPPGGMNDRLARLIQPVLESKLRVPVIVKNMPGAGNSVAIAHVKGLKDASHTFILSQDDFIVATMFQNNLSYRDFTPVVVTGKSTLTIVGGPQQSSAKFAQQVKDGATVNIANNGVNGNSDLWLASFKTKLIVNRIPYKGGGTQMVVDLKNGALDYGVISAANAKSYIDGGLIVPIAVASIQRDPLYPKTPTIKEVGIDGYPSAVWNAIFVRNDVAPEVSATMSTVVREIVKNHPGFETLRENGMTILNYDIPQSKKFINSEVTRFEQLKKATDIK
jgi:tripartite-type tricarboxylate transporter receptor subunit TctC